MSILLLNSIILSFSLVNIKLPIDTHGVVSHLIVGQQFALTGRRVTQLEGSAEAAMHYALVKATEEGYTLVLIARSTD